jgi:hypothetical protein
MRRLKRNHQKQPTIDQLGAAPGAAPASRRRSTPGAPRVTGSGQLRGWHVSRGLQHPPPSTGQLRGYHVSLQLRTRGKTSSRVAQKQSSGRFFSTRSTAQGSSGGSACPRSSGPNENHRADAEELAEPGRCKATPIRSKRNRARGGGGRQLPKRSRSNLRRAGYSRSEGGDGRVAPNRGDEEETPVEG